MTQIVKKPFNLKDKIDDNIKILGFLTDRIKRREHIVNQDIPNQKELDDLLIYLMEYQKKTNETLAYLEEYFKQEEAAGNVVRFTYKMIYKKLKS